MGIGMCVLAAPELVVGAVIVTGVVVVGFAIKEALDADELKWERPEREPLPETKPAVRELLVERRTLPEDSWGPNWPPLLPPKLLERERRPECEPRKVKHRGGNPLHNLCADNVPNNDFSGWDALVNGKNFDALQMRTLTLWEVKTNAIEKYSPFVRRTELDTQVEEAKRERALAMACGYHFVIGVRTEAHRLALIDRDPSFTVVVMDWC